MGCKADDEVKYRSNPRRISAVRSATKREPCGIVFRVAPLPLRGDGRGRNAGGVGRSSRLIPTEDIKSQTTDGVLILFTETKAQERRAQRTKGRPSGIVFVFYIKSAETSWPTAMALRI